MYVLLSFLKTQRTTHMTCFFFIFIYLIFINNIVDTNAVCKERSQSRIQRNFSSI